MSRFRNVQDDGNWKAGETYTFEYEYITDGGFPPFGFAVGGMHPNSARDIFFTPAFASWLIANPASVPDKETFGLGAGEWTFSLASTVWSGSGGEDGNSGVSSCLLTSYGAWRTCTVVVSEDAEVDDEYKLLWAHASVDVTITETETFDITIVAPSWVAPPTDLISFPPDRADDYDDDAIWVPGLWSGGVYTPPAWGGYEDGELIVAGGGRWNKQMIALGHNAVYFEELT